MKNKLELLKAYPEFIVKLIKTKSDKIPSEKDFSNEVVKILKIDNIKMWSRIWNIIYILEDTEEAKNNFYKFGISGPTKYNETGEKYLRLYGLLNSIWLQMNAIVELYSIFKCNFKNELLKNLKSLEIINLRNIAGAHTINYLDENKNRITSYAIARITLDNDEILCLDENNKGIEINLIKSLDEYNNYMISIFEIISNKIINSIYKNDLKQKEIFTNDLNSFYEIAKGNIVINTGENKIIISTKTE